MKTATHVRRHSNTLLKPNGVKSDDYALILTTKGWAVAHKTTNQDLLTSSKFRRVFNG